MAYLVLEPRLASENLNRYTERLISRLSKRSRMLGEDYPLAASIFGEAIDLLKEKRKSAVTPKGLLEDLIKIVADKIEHSKEEAAYTWEEVALVLDEQKQLGQVFKDPGVLSYISGLQQALIQTDGSPMPVNLSKQPPSQ